MACGSGTKLESPCKAGALGREKSGYVAPRRVYLQCKPVRRRSMYMGIA